MKVIIQIPCYNEEETLATTLAHLPRELPGVDTVEWLVIDDGSADCTAEVAAAHGIDHIVRHPENLGLARAFVTGLDACLDRGADIIVNTDADNQYCAADIPALVEPILRGDADMAIGARPIANIHYFSRLKKILQRVGSWAVRLASRTAVTDAPSGFRAISRRAAMQLNVFTHYTYTLETIIQAGHKGLSVVSVPVRINDQLRRSRLVKSIPSYLGRSIATIFRIFVTYRPMHFFLVLGSIPFAAGFLLGLRFLVFYALGQGGGKIQSLIFASLLMSMGFFLFILAMLADLIAVNRQLLEKLNFRIRKVENSLRTGQPK